MKQVVGFRNLLPSLLLLYLMRGRMVGLQGLLVQKLKAQEDHRQGIYLLGEEA